MTILYKKDYFRTSPSESAAEQVGFVAFQSQEDGSYAPVVGATFSGELNVDAITDEELRATPVPISVASLPLPTGANAEATQLLVKAAVEALANLISGGALPVSGPLTNAEMRATNVESLTIANNEALSGAFDMSSYYLGLVEVPDSWTDANIGFKGCDTVDGTYKILKDKTGVPIQISGIDTTTGAVYAIPTEILTAKFVKLWSKNTTAATETDNNQTGAKALKVWLK